MKILANDGISAAGEKQLAEAGFEVITSKVAQEQLATFINQNEVEVLLVRSATKAREELIDACPGLKMIGRGGVGMDNIDVSYARSKGIQVVNTPASSSDSVAELVIAHLFSMVRFLYDSNRQMPLSGDSQFKELKKAYSKGTELNGKTMGIIGIGRIGQAVARRAFGLGMNVICSDQKIGMEADVKLEFFNGQSVDFKLSSVSLEEVLSNSDFVSIHIPGGGEAVIGERELALMKKGSCLINAARGGVVDEKALVQALEDNHLAHAALDVFESEPTPPIQLLMNSKLSLSPHIGAATLEAQDRIGEELASLIIDAFKK
jgi:D-3-phosphoglycerate dehydrogenase